MPSEDKLASPRCGPDFARGRELARAGRPVPRRR